MESTPGAFLLTLCMSSLLTAQGTFLVNEMLSNNKAHMWQESPCSRQALFLPLDLFPVEYQTGKAASSQQGRTGSGQGETLVVQGGLSPELCAICPLSATSPMFLLHMMLSAGRWDGLEASPALGSWDPLPSCCGYGNYLMFLQIANLSGIVKQQTLGNQFFRGF